MALNLNKEKRHEGTSQLNPEKCSVCERGQEPGESLRQLSQSVKRVEVRTLPVTRQRLTVQFNAVNGLQTRLVQITAGETDSSVTRRTREWNR